MLYIYKIFYFGSTVLYWVCEMAFGYSYFSDTCLSLILMGFLSELTLALSRPINTDKDESIEDVSSS